MKDLEEQIKKREGQLYLAVDGSADLLLNALKQIKELREDRISLIMWVYEEVASHPLSLENANSFLEDYNNELNKH